MKKKNIGFSLLFTLCLVTSGCDLISSSSNTISSYSSTYVKEYDFNVLSVNDVHGRLVTSSSENGLDRLAYSISTLENQYGDFIKIANGDIFQGQFESNVMYGRPMVDCLNAMDFDAFVIGNHEFDWGLDKIAAYNDGNLENGEAEFDFITCNIVYKGTNDLLSWTKPYIIKEVNNAKVGIIGAIGSKLTSSINAGMLKDYEFLDSYTQIKKYASELRTTHEVDRVIVAMHDHNIGTLDNLGRLRGNEKIDAVFTAHTHREEDFLVQNRMPVLQGGGNNKKLSYMLFDEKTITPRISTLKTDIDPKINEIIKSYIDGEISEKGNEVLGFNTYYKDTGAMAILLANAMKETFDADVGITNYARTGLNKGDILMKEMYEVFPFDNMIIKASISGKILKSFVNYASGIYYNDDFISSSLEDDKTYTIAVIDYVYDNERFKGFFNNDPSIRVEQNVYMRDLMIDYIRAKEEI